MTEQRFPNGASKRADPQNAPERPPVFRTADMFAGGNEVIIEHCGAVYRLRQTSQGKLILTK
jgi:hemin uptake protein HemP